DPSSCPDLACRSPGLILHCKQLSRTRMLSNLKIGPRLALAFGVVLALLGVMAGVAAWQMGKLAANTAEYATDLVPSFAAQHQISLSVADERRAEFRHI